MKKLMTLIAVTVLGAALVAPAMAQNAGPKGAPGQGAGQPRQGGGMRMGRMAEMEKGVLAKLNLNASQKTKWEAMNKKYAEKMQAEMKKMREAGGGQRPGGQAGAGAGRPGGAAGAGRPGGAGMAAFRELSEARQKEVQTILTKDQFKKYQELMKAEREKMRANRPGGGGGLAQPGNKGGGKTKG